MGMILQLVHYAIMPVGAALAVPRVWAVLVSFFSIFVLWCIHFNALDLEFPFGTRVNDLPMNELQQDWNKSICNLLADRACRPPKFVYEAETHGELNVAMSDASDLYIPKIPQVVKSASTIKIRSQNRRGRRPQPRTPFEAQPVGTEASDKTEPPKNEVAAVDLVPSGPLTASPAEIPARREGPDLVAKDTGLAIDLTLASGNRQGPDVRVPATEVPLAINPAPTNIASSQAPNSRTSQGGAAGQSPPIELTMAGVPPASQSSLAGSNNAVGETQRQYDSRQKINQGPQNGDGLKL